MKALYLISLLFSCLFDLFVLVLGKHTLLGWLLSILVFAGFVCFRSQDISKRIGLLRLAVWIGLFILLYVACVISRPQIHSVPAVSDKDAKPTQVYRVKQGDLTGVYNADESVEVFAGIPYAKPPVDDLRWKEPQDPVQWEGIRICDHFAPMSMQSRTNTILSSLTDIFVYHRFHFSFTGNYLEPMSEDSLYLNIWKPADVHSDMPVLFFIHGGSLTGGQTSFDAYNGEYLASQGIIVVNCAYRLNIFGYYANSELAEESLNGTTGNYGLLDQIHALKWVHDNIEVFGGDPNNITIAGESAGSSSVNAICVSPLAKGLFRRAIAESSGITPKDPYHTFRSLERALDIGSKIMEEFGAKNIDDLRAVPAEELLHTDYPNNAMTVDGYAIIEQPYLTYQKHENNEEALLNGFNKHEADLFNLFTKVTTDSYEELLIPVLGNRAAEAAILFPPEEVDPSYKVIVERGGDAKGAFNKVYSAAWFTYSHFDWSRYISNESKPVYMYYFSKDNRGIGSNHSGEMAYFFGNLNKHASLYTVEDEELSSIMSEYWLNYIRCGDPNNGSLPDWEIYDPKKYNVMEFGSETCMITDPFSCLYELFDSYQNS